MHLHVCLGCDSLHLQEKFRKTTEKISQAFAMAL